MIRRGRQPERFLATILFTDIVGSTDLAVELGDSEWRRVVAAHHAIIRRQLRSFGGREIDTAGDGFFASFAQPAQALRAADGMLAETAGLNLILRAGVHTGECEMIGKKVGGVAVHIAARVMATADGGQVLTSSTTRDLVSGSGLEFSDAGTHPLKGIPGEWHLFSLVRHVQPSSTTQPPLTAEGAGQGAGRRRTVLVVAGMALVLVLVAGLAGAAALGAFNPAATEPATEPGPNTVVVIDRASRAVTDVLDVPSGPVALELSGNRLWVATLDAGIVVDMSTTGDGDERTTGRVGRPTDLSSGDGKIWVADEFDQNVTLIDERNGDSIGIVENVVARGIVYGSGSAWATDDLADRVLRLDRQSGAVAQSVQLDLGSFPSGIAIRDDVIWVGNVGTDTLARIDALAASVVTSGISLGATPESVAVGERDVWVAMQESDQLKRVDSQTNAVSATIDVCDQPVSLAVDGEGVWVGCAGSLEVVHLDREGSVIGRVAVGGVPSDIAVGSDQVFVAVRGL